MLAPIHVKPRPSLNGSVGPAKSTPAMTKSTPSLPVLVSPADEETRHVSKLETEVLKLEARGTALVQSEGSELEGIALLEKALRARARFPALNTDAWQRAEQFVVVCNQLAVRVMQRLDNDYVDIANELMRAAERTLCNSGGDSFTGFHPLRQALLGATLSNMAALHILDNEMPEVALTAIEKAIAVEAPRPSTLSLFNLAAILVRMSRFDDAMQAATKVIALADHYLKLHVNLNPSNEEAFTCFQAEAASHAVLAHHLIVSVAVWCGLGNIAQHHAKLALRCAERYLGQHHALTSRAMHRVQAIAQQASEGLVAARDSLPPQIQLQMATFTAPCPPSLQLPFTLVSALPSSVSEIRVDTSKLPPLFVSSSSPTADRKRPVLGTSVPPVGAKAATPSTAPINVTRPKQQHVPAPPTTGAPNASAVRPGAQRTESLATTSARAPRPPAGTAPKRQPISARANAPRQGADLNVTKRDDDDTASTISNAPTETYNRDAMAARDPVVEAWPTPIRAATVSTIAKLDYELYTALQSEVAQMMECASQPVAIARHSAGGSAVMPVQGPLKARFEAGNLHFSDADVASSYRAAGVALSKLSLVRPDHTDEDEVIWDRAARKLQQWTRCRLAVVALRRKQAALRHYFARVEAAGKIERAMSDFLARKEAKAQVRVKRDQKRRLDDFVWAVQSTARTYLSYVEYCRRVEAALASELAARRLARKRRVAATGIQACWRSFAARKAIRRVVTAATMIQRFRRLYRLYLLMRVAVFQRRETKRVEWKRRDRAALRIQAWWKHAVKVKRAKRVRAAKMQRLEEYLSAKTEREIQAWRRFAGVDEDTMAKVLQRFFRFLVWSHREATRQITQRRRRQAASKIQRAYRWSQASTVRERRRALRNSRRTVQKRKEDVWEATCDIQRIVRGFLARCRFRRLQHMKQVRLNAVNTLHRFAAMIRCVSIKREHRAQLEWDRERYLIAASRRFAATKIQSVYRMVRDKAFVRQYRGFMVRDRHQYASRIQRAWRFYAARQVRLVQWRARDVQRQATIRAELMVSVAKRIQHAFRTFVIRTQLKRRLAAPVSKQVQAALKIQRAVRYFLARALVLRLLTAKRFELQATAGEEHLHAYAMVIQRQARRAFIAPQRIRQARESKTDWAARVVQRFMRSCRDRRIASARRAVKLHEEEEAYEREERDFSAVRIQKLVRGALVRTKRSKRALAVTKIARWFRMWKCRQILVSRMRARAASLNRVLDAERHNAAAAIQAAWRRSEARRRKRAG